MVRRRTVKVKQAGMILSPKTIIDTSKGKMSQWIDDITDTVGSNKVPLPVGFVEKKSSRPMVSFETILPYWGRVGFYAGSYGEMVEYSARNNSVSTSSLAFRMVASDNFTGKQWRTLTERELTEWGFSPEFAQLLQRVTGTGVYGGRSRHSSLTVDEGWRLFTAAELTKLYELVNISAEEYNFDPETNIPYAHKQFTSGMRDAGLTSGASLFNTYALATYSPKVSKDSIGAYAWQSIGRNASKVQQGRSGLSSASKMAKVSAKVKDGIQNLVTADKEMVDELKELLAPYDIELKAIFDAWIEKYNETVGIIVEKLNTDAQDVLDRYKAARGGL